MRLQIYISLFVFLQIIPTAFAGERYLQVLDNNYTGVICARAEKTRFNVTEATRPDLSSKWQTTREHVQITRDGRCQSYYLIILLAGIG